MERHHLAGRKCLSGVLIDEFTSIVCFFILLRYISYPRTETNIFPENLPLGPLVEQQTQSPVWGTFAQRVMDQPGGPNPRQGKKSDQAHPPIHPTKFSNALQVSLQKTGAQFVQMYLFFLLLI